MTPILVFGSNEGGIHGKGAALTAKLHWGAIWGQGRGLQGRSYAIPTKDASLRTRNLEDIKVDFRIFVEFARNNPGMMFLLTPIGTGYAGIAKRHIATMVREANLPANVVLTHSWVTD